MINSQRTQQIFRKLQEDPLNRICFECDSPAPTWASLPNAILICYTCSGVHRGMGVHLSFVRSTTIDSWSDRQLEMMNIGGNNKLKDYFAFYGIQVSKEQEMSKKYRTKAGAYYREKMRSLVDGFEFPDPPEVDAGWEEETRPQLITPQTVPELVAQQPQYQSQQNQQNEEDNLERMKSFIQKSYLKTAEVTKGAIQKVDQKLSDPTLQNNIKEFKDQSTKVVQTKYKEIKHGLGNAWDYVRNKMTQTNTDLNDREVQSQETEKHQPPQFEQQSQPMQLPEQRPIPQTSAINFEEFFEDYQSDQYNQQQQESYQVTAKADNQQELFLMNFEDDSKVVVTKQTNLMDFDDYQTDKEQRAFKQSDKSEINLLDF